MYKLAAIGTAVLAGSQGALATGAYTGDTGQVFEGVQLSDLNSLYSGQYTYENVGYDASGNCKEAGSAGQITSSSPIAPLDGEMHHVMRGPLKLAQFAVYTLGGSAPAKRSRVTPHERRHGHQKFHEEHKREQKRAHGDKEKRAFGDLVTATIDGKVVQFTDDWDLPAATEAPAAPTDTPTAADAAQSEAASTSNLSEGDGFLQPASSAGEPVAATSEAPAETSATPSEAAVTQPAVPSIVESAAPSSATSSASAPDSPSGGSGAWSRIAYYNAASQTAQGLVFLANSWDGNILYASADGVQANAGESNTPTVLSNTQVDQNNEFIIASDQKCNGDCGLTYSGSSASSFDAARSSNLYHGWSGDRVVIAEYSMPHVDASGLNGDMPGWWSLASSIVNNQQYGSCTPWTAGAGELDIHEVLSSDLSKGYVSTHMGKIYGGQGPAITRPATGTLKIALILNGTTAAVQALPSDTELGTSMADGDILAWLSQHKSIGNSLLKAAGGAGLGGSSTTWTPTASPPDDGSVA